MESIFDELKRYVGFGAKDEALLKALHPVAKGEFARISEVFYERILDHEQARLVLEGGESQVGKLKPTLIGWMDGLFSGPWDNDYFQLRCRIGRVHVKIGLPQHYMFGAMNVLRSEFSRLIEHAYHASQFQACETLSALEKLLDLELAVMLHTYREDLVDRKLRAVVTMSAGLSHEIRNPLNAAMLQLEVLELRTKKISESDTKTSLLGPLGLVKDEIRRLNQILEDFLMFAKPRNQLPEAVDINTIAQSVLGLLEASSAEKEIRLVVTLGSIARIQGDPDRLKQAIMNLVINAIHAARHGGSIRIITEQQTLHTAFIVEDDGPGISKEQQERIFEPFFTTKATGSGLGLPIVHAIVDQHGGRIVIDRSDLGGARFLVRFPSIPIAPS